MDDFSDGIRAFSFPPAEFIARQRASASPLAAPVGDGEAMPEELQTARLALLLMRGTVVMKRPVDENRYIVEPDSTPISRDEAAYRLARMPKPLRCQPTVRDGVMAVRCRGITEPSDRGVNGSMGSDSIGTNGV